MVEIIKESNDDLNKNLFLKELSKVADGVTLQITRISDAFESKKKNDKSDFIYIDFLILDDFTGKFKLNPDGRADKSEATLSLYQKVFLEKVFYLML